MNNGDGLVKVSVIVATYRRSKSLETALNSLINQTYNNIEIIVVDDNADVVWNERVNSIVSKCSNLSISKIVYIKNEDNKGSAATRNEGIDIATGTYITFLDDDDVYLPNKVKNQITHMIENNSDYSITDLWLYDEQGTLIEKRSRQYLNNYSPDSLIRNHLMFHLTGTDVMMFKKSYLLEIGKFSPINIGDEFYLMEKAIIGNGSFSYLKGCDVKAYVHSETTGLSSGEGKIDGENELFQYKKKYFSILTFQERQYIRMRHYAVIAFAEYRRKGYLTMTKNLVFSFMASPIDLMILIAKRK